MPRWEPGTRDRLERAALELFAERGYDGVTVADIARRAGVTKATFFRTFPDKREVLFWGQDLLADLLTRGVAAAPVDATTPELLGAALASLSSAFPPERHEVAPARQAIVGSHAELQERLAFKRSVLRDALERALRDRGVPLAEARVAAELGRAAYSAAYRRWGESAAPADFDRIAQHELRDLLAAAARLGAGTGG